MLAGAMTHFATSDDDQEFAREQLAAFVPFVAAVRELASDVIAHAANSAAALGIPESRLDMVRCGVATYGLDPFQHDPADHGLSPAMTLASYVAEVKPVAPGQSAGYGRTFVADEPSLLATLPIGYADGVRRALSNNAEVLIGGRRFPLVGTVSMDNVTVLVDDTVQRGDEAILVGSQGEERVLAEEWAQRIGTINYEITCGVSARVPRA
jgi:alanine racemase